MNRKQESTINFQEIEELNRLIPQELKEAIDFKKRFNRLVYLQNSPQQAILARNQLFTALFTIIINELGGHVDNDDTFSLSGMFSGFWEENEVFSEIQGNLGSKELFLSRLEKIHQICKTNKIPAKTDMIKVTQKILGYFNYLQGNTAAEDKRQQNKQKLLELTKHHDELVEFLSTGFNPFESLYIQGFRNLPKRDAILKDLIANRLELIEASRPYLEKSQDAAELIKRNQQLEKLKSDLHNNSEAINQRVDALNSLIAVFNDLNAVFVNELEKVSTFDSYEPKAQKTDKKLANLKAARQKLIDQSMLLKEPAQDSDELNDKIDQLRNLKEKLLDNSSKICKREEILYNRMIKKNKPRMAVFMTEQEIADEKAAVEKIAVQKLKAQQAAEKAQQVYSETYKLLLKYRKVNSNLHAQIKQITDNFNKLSNQNLSWSVSQDSSVIALQTQYRERLQGIEKRKLQEKDPASMQSIEDLQNERDSLIIENKALKKDLIELANINKELGNALDSSKQTVEDAKAAIANKIESIENFIAPLKDKEPYKSYLILKKKENGLSQAEQIILRQKNIAANLSYYSTMSLQERTQYALKNLEDLNATLEEVCFRVKIQYQAELAKFSQNLESLKSLPVCRSYKGDCVNKIMELETKLAKLEISSENPDLIVDQEIIDTLEKEIKKTAISLHAKNEELKRNQSDEIKIVRELIQKIDETLNKRRQEIGIDDQTNTNDLVITTLTDFKTQLSQAKKDYLDLKDPRTTEVARLNFINSFLKQMQTTLTEDKIQQLTDSTDSNFLIDFFRFLFSSIEALIDSSNKKTVYRAQFWPSTTEVQVIQAATQAQDALNDLQTQLEAGVKAPVNRKNAE